MMEREKGESEESSLEVGSLRHSLFFKKLFKYIADSQDLSSFRYTVSWTGKPHEDSSSIILLVTPESMLWHSVHACTLAAVICSIHCPVLSFVYIVVFIWVWLHAVLSIFTEVLTPLVITHPGVSEVRSHDQLCYQATSKSSYKVNAVIPVIIL